MSRWLAGALALALWGCDDGGASGADAGAGDAAVSDEGAADGGGDVGIDGGEPDGAVFDAMARDGIAPDEMFAEDVLVDGMDGDGGRMDDMASADMASADMASTDFGDDDMASVDMASADLGIDDMAPDAAVCVPSADDERCDGLDDDCDGRIDERGADFEIAGLGLVAEGDTRGAVARALDCAAAPGPAVRLRWVAPADGRYTFDTRGSGFDTAVQAERDACAVEPPCGADGAVGDVRGAVTVAATAGEAWVVTIGGEGPDAAGPYVLTVGREQIGPLEDGDFSTAAQAAIAALRAGHAGDEGTTWGISGDAGFGIDAFLQIPDASTWGRAPAEVEAVPSVAPDAPAGSFDPDFMLPYCESDADCAAGRCRVVAATVQRPGALARRLCMGPSDHVWDAMYAVLAGARRFADVSSLDFPDNAAGVEAVERGRFLVALRNALRYLDATGEPVAVRFLFGWLVNDFDWDDALAGRVAALTEGIGDDTRLRLWFGGMNYQLFSWNHSKIIAADGDVLVEGGINFYSTDYLGVAPVQDLSLRLRRGPTRDAHRYLDAIWRVLVDDFEGFGGDFDGVYTTLATVPEGIDPPGDAPLAGGPHGAGGVRVVSLGRLGLIDRDGVVDPAPSDDAMLAAIGAAEERLDFSLQDLGSVRDGVIFELPGGQEVDLSYGWPEALMRTLTARVLAGVQVRIVISETGAGAYSYGWSKREALEAWRDVIEADPVLADEVVAAAGSATALLCERVALASVRIDGSGDRWSDGAAMGNHAKFFMVDRAAFYVGSQNLYLSNLFEWGLLVDDVGLATQIDREYWGPLWAASGRSAESGPGVERCALREE